MSKRTRAARLRRSNRRRPAACAGALAALALLLLARPSPPAAGAQGLNGADIEGCGADAACREVKRVDTSAAFFLSIEFQRTGFLAYRLYRAALPGGVYRPRSLPRYTEFVRDTQEVGRGVVVGEDGWERRLAENTALHLEDFVSRAEFALAYPESLTPAEYVDKLNAQAGGVLDAAERDALVAGLGARPRRARRRCSGSPRTTSSSGARRAAASC